MFLFMAFNEPRILNQSRIKENKQGHLDDPEDHCIKKWLSSVTLNSFELSFS